MSQDVRQWLTEIKSLQQQLAAIQQERDEAYVSAANWRNLYETEARQRRTDIALAQQSIDSLKAEVQQMRELPSAGEDADTLVFIQQEVNQMQGGEELRSALVRALVECDRISRSLKAEQTAHGQTCKALTTALGDTVDLLAKERTAKERATRKQTAKKPPVSPASAANNGSSNGSSVARKAEIKAPSLELPQLD